jgi:hypothetical protein
MTIAQVEKIYRATGVGKTFFMHMTDKDFSEIKKTGFRQKFA